MKKPKAADRTVSFLDGKTEEEKANEAERIKQGLDNVEQPKEAVTIERSVDRWRDQAFQGQEHVSGAFGDENAEENQYRCSIKGNHFYLEKTGNNDRGAYSYAGVMFPIWDLLKVARVFVAAAREHVKVKP